MTRRGFGAVTAAVFARASALPGKESESNKAIRIGTRRELFVDRELIQELRGAELRPGAPVYAGEALRLDRPWEGAFSTYTTILADGGLFRMYYRGAPAAGEDGDKGEVTCYAESRDGVHWSKPELGLYEVRGTRHNNVILANQPPLSHNFCPMIDTRPGVAPGERYKAVAGVHRSGLHGFVSADGIHWKKIQKGPVFPAPEKFSLDSQNIAFWSEHEQRYLLYYRTWKRIGKTNYRWISRAVSDDFLHWTPQGEMEFGDVPPEHLYTNQTAAYFRAPHIYAGICARFLPGREVLSPDQARALRVNPKYYKDCSDTVLITSRGGNRCQRTFLEAFLRPGIGLENWVSRSNYPALNLVQTSAQRMSFFVNRNYAQPTSYVGRYELRLDGLASAHAGYAGGELTTRPLLFEGNRLELNYSTSAAGGVRVEIQDASGRPVPRFTLADARELIGDQINRVYAWHSGEDVSPLRGRPVRLRFVLKDADLFAYRFRS